MRYGNKSDVTQKKMKKKQMFLHEEAKLKQIFYHKNAPKMMELKRVVKFKVAQMHTRKLVVVIVKMIMRWKKVRCWKWQVSVSSLLCHQDCKSNSFFFKIYNLKDKSSTVSCSGEASRKLVKVKTASAVMSFLSRRKNFSPEWSFL